jgi:hypothetical protein
MGQGDRSPATPDETGRFIQLLSRRRHKSRVPGFSGWMPIRIVSMPEAVGPAYRGRQKIQLKSIIVQPIRAVRARHAVGAPLHTSGIGLFHP